MTESLGSLYLYVHLDPCLCEHNSIVKISSSCAVLALSYQQLSHCMEKKKEYPSTPSHCEAGRLQIQCKNQSLSVLQFWISYTYFHRLSKSTRLEETAIADKADQVLFCFQGYKCTPCPETWLQYGENCYYFSKEWKTWQESKARCSALESRFLKIESKKELVKILFCCSFLFLSTCTTSNVV
uniref:C-type lectin domain-containing protein n=1 Tax=Anser cygnoides TaxID=8845 RepID=A0A8B9IL43_ANSCY